MLVMLKSRSMTQNEREIVTNVILGFFSFFKK